ncbi:hypothetical protein ACFPRL_17320 [Pseudoclavibacter helvolus]
MLLGQGQRFVAVGSFADNTDALGAVDEQAQAHADTRLVVDDEHADAVFGHHGSFTSTTKSPRALAPASREPPTRWTRSRAPISP